jgi:hypothetical protein
MTPTETTTPQPASLTVVAPASGTADVAIAASSISGVLAGSPTDNSGGSITFTVLGPQTSAPTSCTDGTTVGIATSVPSIGTYYPSSGFTPGQAGNYWWYASYDSDANGNYATSSCGPGMPETVVAGSVTTTSVAPSGRGGQ